MLRGAVENGSLVHQVLDFLPGLGQGQRGGSFACKMGLLRVEPAAFNGG